MLALLLLLNLFKAIGVDGVSLFFYLLKASLSQWLGCN